MWNFLKRIFSAEDEGGVIELEWNDEENESFNEFSLKHFKECSSTSPWLCSRYVNGKMLKKVVCPICGEEKIINEDNTGA